MNALSSLLCVALCFSNLATRAGDAIHPGQRHPVAEGWQLQSSVLVTEDGERVSTVAYRPQQWHKTSVPSTVLNALIHNGVYPDPRIGMNCFQIPDASDEFNRKHDLARFSHLPDKRNPWRDPYWYRTEFRLADLPQGRHVWLNFQAINYRADVWLNGKRVADRQTMVGALRRFRFDITSFARSGKNCLAVKVYPPDHPGEPQTQLEVLGKDRRFASELMKDVTMPMFIGYDCMPPVPDRNMGLWQEVFLDFSGAVDIRDPFVVTDLPLPATSPAYLTVSAELVNASALPQKGVLRGRIEGDATTLARLVELAPGETKTVVFSRAEGPQPVIRAPRLWWPNNYGPQNLYRLALQFESDGTVSDVETTTFGVRTITKELHELDGQHGLRLLVNGKRVFVRGGYIQPEILFDWNARRMDTEVRYYTQANLNHVYFEDIGNPPDEFLDACDRRGLLFGNCFYGCYWMTRKGLPQDVRLLEECTIDIVRRYRNHPCLWLYMAMNEGDTREDVYRMWRKHVRELDGTRIHIPSGSFPDYRDDVPPWIREDMPVGMNDWRRGKSYGWQDPAQYFRWVRDERGWMFMMECGSASLPPVDSLRRFIPDLWDALQGPAFPLTPTWAHHGANEYYKPYDAAVRRIHGPPASVEDYCFKGHLTTAEQHRAMFEAVNHRLWDVTGGLTQWKINSCWPSVQWQIFDWYLRPMVSYYYLKRACEPLHIQLCPVDSMVTVVNHRREPSKDLSVRARVYDFDMKLRCDKAASVSVGENTYRDVFALPAMANLEPIHFVHLELADSDGRTVSDNFYWLSPRSPPDYTALGRLPLVDLRVSEKIESRGDETVVSVKVDNPTNHLALIAHLAVTKGSRGDEVLPVFWSDNYVSLLPHQSRTLTAIVATNDLAGSEPRVEVGGWNVRSPYRCEKIKVSRTETRAGEPLTVTATVADTFLDGSLVELTVDDAPVEARRVWGRGGAPRPVEFTVTLTTPGTHVIRVGDKAVAVTTQ